MTAVVVVDYGTTAEYFVDLLGVRVPMCACVHECISVFRSDTQENKKEKEKHSSGETTINQEKKQGKTGTKMDRCGGRQYRGRRRGASFFFCRRAILRAKQAWKEITAK